MIGRSSEDVVTLSTAMPLRTLIDAATLAGQINHADWRIIDCRFDLKDPDAGRRAYLAGHIPGALYAHLDHDLSAARAPDTGRHPLPDPAQLAHRFSEWGIAEGTQVVVYDDQAGAIAARLWWLLHWMGHRRAAVLDGGLQAWSAHGGVLVEGEETGAKLADAPVAGTPRQPNPGAIIETPALEQLVAAGGARLIDVRSAARYAGEEEPIDPVAGHVPGATNDPYTNNLDAQGRFLPADELRRHYQRLLAGADPAQAILMCGSGVTACHSLLAMAVAGLPGGRLYAGSWSEWITDARRPVAIGNGQ